MRRAVPLSLKWHGQERPLIGRKMGFEHHFVTHGWHRTVSFTVPALICGSQKSADLLNKRGGGGAAFAFD